MKREKKVRITLVLALLILCLVHALADEGRLMRFPDCANGTIVFVYQNDLWSVQETGGRAHRLTAFDGIESNPKFSPDGKWIAFNAQYNGNTNVYVIPAGGGEPIQLTYHPEDVSVVEWSPDGKKILYVSRRLSIYPLLGRFFEISIDGGAPQVLPIDEGFAASYSPDGDELVFNRHDYLWWTKRYKGSLNRDLWLLDRSSGMIEQLTTWEGNDSWPMWAVNKIYFASEREGISNIYSYDYRTREITKVTHHQIDGVQWPSIGNDRNKIVYENEGRLWLLNTALGQYKEVKVEISTDFTRPMVEWINPFSEYFFNAAISPSGRRVLVEARGEIFSLPAGKGETRNLTQSSNSRDQFPAWSPNGKYVAFISDASGEHEVYIVHQMGTEKPKRLTSTGGFKYNPIWSPDSNNLLYYNHKHDLMMLDVSAEIITKIANSPWADVRQYCWSPDSSWIAYILHQRNENSIVYLHSLETGERARISDGHAQENCPVFDPGGKYLFFLSTGRAHEVAHNFVSIGMVARTIVMAVSLAAEEHEPFKKEEEEEPITEREIPSAGAGEISARDALMKMRGLTGTQHVNDIDIDLEGISERVLRLPVKPGQYSDLTATNTHLYYLAKIPSENILIPANHLICWDVKNHTELPVLKGIRTYSLNTRGDKILYYTGTFLGIIRAGIPSQPGVGMVNTANMFMRLDRRAEWRQIFYETWRVIRDYFYDSNMHGVDWPAVKRFYENLLPYVKTRSELDLLLKEMIGELNGSHLDAGGIDIERIPLTRVPVLGAELEPDLETGYYRFAKIYRGDRTESSSHHSPLDANYVKIDEGDYLLKINAKEVRIDENYLRHLVGMTGNVTLTTNSQPKPEGAIETTIRPVHFGNTITLRKKDWEERNKALVDKLSGGVIGYVKLTDMVLNGLEGFVKALREHRFKGGLIIDVRFNGGGNIDRTLIDILERKAYQITKERGGSPLFRPADSFYGHVVVLINEHCYSNAEMFANAFRMRKLGKVIGMPTSGTVTGSEAYSLMDKGGVSKATTGLWNIQGQQLEGRGAFPDIEVRNMLDDFATGKDAQLEMAVEYLLQQIREHPVPKPEDFETSVKAR